MTNLPNGFDTLDQLAQTDAGRVYLLARCMPERETYQRAVDFLRLIPEQVETCDPPRLDCYAWLFADQSVLIVSTADDEVWADEADYLSHYDLQRHDDPEIGWIYR